MVSRKLLISSRLVHLACWLALAEVCMMIRITVANEQNRCSPESSEAPAGLKDKMGCCRVRLRDILRITRRQPSGCIGFMTFLTAKLVVKVTFKIVVCMNSVLSSSLVTETEALYGLEDRKIY